MPAVLRDGEISVVTREEQPPHFQTILAAAEKEGKEEQEAKEEKADKPPVFQARRLIRG